MIALVAFLYLVFNISSLWVNVTDVEFCPAAKTDNCEHKQELDFLASVLPLIVSIAVVVGAMIYYLMSEKVESKELSLKKNTEIILRFLSPEEKKLVNALIENRGKVLQAEIFDCKGEKPGEIIESREHLIVAVSQGALRITQLQLEGKKPMTAEEFLRGHTFPSGTVLG